MITSASSHNWIILAGGGVLLFNVINGMATGSAILFYRYAKRSEDPLLYWISIALSAVLGVAALLIFIFYYNQ